MLILGLESSCDETAASVVEGPGRVLANVIATQDDLHAKYAGVVPEIASRAHLERIGPVVDAARRAAGVDLGDLDAVAVGHRPGLIGSLLVAVSAAKTLAWSLGRPLIGVDHVHAHLYAPFLHDAAEPAPSAPVYPAIGLVVSGGHTTIFRLEDPLHLTLLGRTRDDAVGEAYDKTATILGLAYPGGPRLDRLAQQGDDTAYEFPVSALEPGSLDFSFSGLKTSVLYAVCGQPVRNGDKTAFTRDAAQLDEREKADFAASFQRAAVTALIRKVGRALDAHPEARTLLVGGGVSANSRLRSELTALGETRGLDMRLPAKSYCVDNAAMIAGLATRRFDAGAFDPLTLSASARSALAAAPHP